MTKLYPLRLKPVPQERIWGTSDLRPYFGEFPEPVGEVWYSFEENIVTNGVLSGRTLASLMSEYGTSLMGARHSPQQLVRRTAGVSPVGNASQGAYFPILTKLLFAEQTLSVQVHPDDAYALKHEGGPGKTELWYVAAAREGASVALGVTQQMSPAELSAAAYSGEIEQYLNWVPVEKGDVLLISPGTLHTLGAGVTICEIQQNSDLTYRFFDFGRVDASGQARPLHIEQGAAVVRMDGPPAKLAPKPLPDPVFERSFLAACPYFSTEKLSWSSASAYQPDPDRFHLLMFLEGEGKIESTDYRPGDCFLVPASADPFQLQPQSPSAALLSYEPAA